MTTKKKVALMVLGLMTLVISGLVFGGKIEPLLANTSEKKATVETTEKKKSLTEMGFEEETKTKKIGVQALNPDVIWTNWQKNAVVTPGMVSGDLVTLPSGEIQYFVQTTFTLITKGDTIAEAGTRYAADINENLLANELPFPDPAIITGPDTWKLWLNKSSSWITLPDVIDDDGNFERSTTTILYMNTENHPGMPEYTGIVKAPHWGHFFGTFLRNDHEELRYRFDGQNGDVAQLNSWKTRMNPPKEDLVTMRNLNHYRLHIPQVVKAVYKDIADKGDTSKVIADQEVAGLGGVLDQEVSHEAKDIADYEFVNYEYVNDQEETAESTDKKWSGKMTEQKQAVIFWYKKKTPDFNLTKVADKQEVGLNETLTYTLDMENTGNGDLKEAKITDTLPEGMAKPAEIKLDGNIIAEGKENANTQGEYFTWNSTSRQLVVYIGTLPTATKRQLTYQTMVLTGTEGEQKRNIAVLTGSNSEEESTAEETIIVKRQIQLHIKQEVMGKNSHLVVPQTGSVDIDNVNLVNLADKRTTLSAVIPSYEVDTDQAFKPFLLESYADYLGYQVTSAIPEFYEYQGYELTTKEATHLSANRKLTPIPVLDYSNQTAYWLTVYIQPTVEKEGPPFYSWDAIVNDFGKIK